LIRERNITLNDLDEKVQILWEEGKTVMFIALDGSLAGMIALSDTIKPGAGEAVRRLHNMG